MPRSRGSELPQRKATRAPVHLRTSGHEADPLHNRPTIDRSPKAGERRSPRGTQSDPLHQKKLGTRITDLESQLGQAQEELKKLKEQLASAEAAKREAQEELEKKAREPVAEETTKEVEKPLPLEEIHNSNRETSFSNPEESWSETDVFEVPLDNIPSEPKSELTNMTEQEENEAGEAEVGCHIAETEATLVLEPVKPPSDDWGLVSAEIMLLKEKLAEKEKQLEVVREENELLKRKVKEAAVESAAFLVMEEETALKLAKMGEDLEQSKANVARLNQQLEMEEGAKAALETEMKKLRVQTEQWRKAADAGAAVLAGGVEMNGRVAGRYGSMEKHLSDGGFETAGGYTGFVGSPMLGDDLDDGFGSGKRKGSGIRMFGDLWKKKGQK
ncbi:PREDICTED: interactor of constitutive active ROPs 1-like [Nelumbo nucifera]|uniref:Interactor of constitutive active ROPs 1-like n=1 Tax=Nelumbo nucifera TaxID=4432 RepID=A0A1U8B279_NELNU|nr:PREDICTED: interactor of constitutive active ROPs 1-like [Nelumbo nucifera]XP_010274850.1 PREDICTED: interactor of constitutive active ROPs 1-like [Nelumbo nucifera]XP_010274859.1 PREDICTED: interactor of constitutive active ROPs 1-like [Nelumbo nucifera]